MFRWFRMKDALHHYTMLHWFAARTVMKLGSIEMRNTVPVAKVERHVLGVWLRLLFGLFVLLVISESGMIYCNLQYWAKLYYEKHQNMIALSSSCYSSNTGSYEDMCCCDVYILFVAGVVQRNGGCNHMVRRHGTAFAAVSWCGLSFQAVCHFITVSHLIFWRISSV